MDPDSGGTLIADRGLVEDAVKLLIMQAPTGWQQLHAEFEPASEPTVAEAVVTTADGQQQPLSVPLGAVAALAEHQRRAAAAGAPWRRLVIDSHADGRLSARSDSAATSESTTPRQFHWLRRGLMGITVVCLTVAAAFFAMAWSWSPPPRADTIPVPGRPAREQAAFDVVNRWTDAKNRGDAAGMRMVSCTNPTRKVTDLIELMEQVGEHDAIVYPDAFTEFNDSDKEIWVTIAVRIHPLNDRMKARAEQAQKSGGFFIEHLVLADENGQLKVCDDSDSVDIHA